MDNATRSSCFGQWISFLNVDQVQSIATRYDNANRYVKKLDLWAFLRPFLYAQVYQFKGLRDLEITVQNNDELKRESVWAPSVSRNSRIPVNDLIHPSFGGCSLTWFAKFR